MLDLGKLRHFLTVARLANFGRAATELHMSQPALTRSIQSLESHLGVQLLERSRGRAGVVLTRAGAALAQHANDVMRRVDELERDVSDNRQRERVSFGVGPMLAREIVHDVLQQILHEYPEVVVTVFVGPQPAMLGQLLAGEIDFYIGLAAPERSTPRIESHFFGLATPRFLVRPGHPLADRDDIGVEDAVRFPLLGATAWEEVQFALSQTLDRRLFDLTMRVDDYTILTELALRSDAIVVASPMAVSHQLQPLSLGLDERSCSSEIFVFNLAATGLSRGAEYVIRMLRAAHRQVQAGE